MLRPIVRGKEVKSVEFEAKRSGGTGYAGTENRDYCKANGIQTSFVKRGRPFVREKGERPCPELARVRAAAMEGSFGTQERALRSPKGQSTRTKWTEILYIFFGIHTANVVQLADRMGTKGAGGGCLT